MVKLFINITERVVRSMLRRKWQFRELDVDTAKRIATEYNIGTFAALILLARGFTDRFEIDEFLSTEPELADPYELLDMSKAVERVRRAVDDFERIAVFGDYDCDGVTSTALVYDYLSEIGADAIYHIPSRKDGFGMNFDAIDIVKEQGVTLIITVDNGIAACDEIAYAKKLGIDVVVTDHHLQSDTLPDAVAVINPQRKDSPVAFKELAGVGVAYKFICALSGKTTEELLDKYADLVAIGTVADVMPLVFDNRAVVRAGARMIKKNTRSGIKALLKAAGAAEREITASTIAYIIAPRINAAGRMGDSGRAVTLLLETDEERANTLAAEICDDNTKRQKIEADIFNEAIKTIEKEGLANDRVIVVAGENWQHGIIGIAASRLVSKYGRPVIILSKDGGSAGGSGRSIAGFDLYEAISNAAQHLQRFGGHTLAAGLSVDSEKIDDFRKDLLEFAKEKYPIMPFPELAIDCELAVKQLDLDIPRALACLEPYGAGNKTPVFALCGMRVERFSGMSNDKHLCIYFSKDDLAFRAVMFGKSPDDFEFESGMIVDIAVTLEENLWQGNESLSVKLEDIRVSGCDDALLTSLRDYESFKRGESTHEDISLLLPTREEAGCVYNEVKRARFGRITADMLVNILSARVMPAKVLVSLDALCQLGVLLYDRTHYSLNERTEKSDFNSSEIIKNISNL